MALLLDNAGFRKEFASAMEDDWLFGRTPPEPGEPFNPSRYSDPESIAKLVKATTDRFQARQDYIHKYGFAVLNEDAVRALLNISPILEVGAGGGYWAYELRKAGADIVATDPFPPGTAGDKPDHINKTYGFEKAWTEVLPMDAKNAITHFRGRNLLMVWPDYDAEWTHEMLYTFRGEFLAYVGEGYGGCTGTDKMHGHIEKHFELVEWVDIPQFWGIHDRLNIYKRKTKKSRASG